jgi:hypothetical protein
MNDERNVVEVFDHSSKKMLRLSPTGYRAIRASYIRAGNVFRIENLVCVGKIFEADSFPFDNDIAWADLVRNEYNVLRRFNENTQTWMYLSPANYRAEATVRKYYSAQNRLQFVERKPDGFASETSGQDGSFWMRSNSLSVSLVQPLEPHPSCNSTAESTNSQ